MLIRNQSEAETLQRFLNGERLWSWPNGKIQLGQSLPDLAIIKRLVSEGLLDQNHQPTDAALSALESWLKGAGANRSISSLSVSAAQLPLSPPNSLP